MGIFTYPVLVFGVGIGTWFLGSVLRDIHLTIRIPFDGEDRKRAFIRRAVIHDD